jgi:hypothetical protein
VDGRGEGEVGDDREGCCSQYPHQMVFNAYTEAAIIDEGNDISEEPTT